MLLVVTACLVALAMPHRATAAPVNLATVTCAKYQNEIIGTPAAQTLDPINLVMWLFGFSVARSGAHFMYGDALAGFGFALDAECKNNPNEVLLDALGNVKPSNKNPMDLTTLDCETFVARHVDMMKSDPESADTIMMWLFGFAVAKSGNHVLMADNLKPFENNFMAACKTRPGQSMYETLAAVKP